MMVKKPDDNFDFLLKELKSFAQNRIKNKKFNKIVLETSDGKNKNIAESAKVAIQHLKDHINFIEQKIIDREFDYISLHYRYVMESLTWIIDLYLYYLYVNNDLRKRPYTMTDLKDYDDDKYIPLTQWYNKNFDLIVKVKLFKYSQMYRNRDEFLRQITKNKSVIDKGRRKNMYTSSSIFTLIQIGNSVAHFDEVRYFKIDDKAYFKDLGMNRMASVNLLLDIWKLLKLMVNGIKEEAYVEDFNKSIYLYIDREKIQLKAYELNEIVKQKKPCPICGEGHFEWREYNDKNDNRGYYPFGPEAICTKCQSVINQNLDVTTTNLDIVKDRYKYNKKAKPVTFEYSFKTEDVCFRDKELNRISATIIDSSKKDFDDEEKNKQKQVVDNGLRQMKKREFLNFLNSSSLKSDMLMNAKEIIKYDEMLKKSSLDELKKLAKEAKIKDYQVKDKITLQLDLFEKKAEKLLKK